MLYSKNSTWRSAKPIHFLSDTGGSGIPITMTSFLTTQDQIGMFEKMLWKLSIKNCYPNDGISLASLEDQYMTDIINLNLTVCSKCNDNTT